MKTMTKKEFTKFAFTHGCDASYSGKERKYYLRKIRKMTPSVLHGLINNRQ